MIIKITKNNNIKIKAINRNKKKIFLNKILKIIRKTIKIPKKIKNIMTRENHNISNKILIKKTIIIIVKIKKNLTEKKDITTKIPKMIKKITISKIGIANVIMIIKIENLKTRKKIYSKIIFLNKKLNKDFQTELYYKVNFIKMQILINMVVLNYQIIELFL